MKPNVKLLENKFYNFEQIVDSHEGVSMTIVTRYDGFGNSRVYFNIHNQSKTTSYEKFDAAAQAFNLIMDRMD